MRYFNTFILLVFTLFLTSFNSNCYSQYKLKTIVIDPGHGGKDPGSIGKNSYEKNITLPISLELGRIIEENLPGIKIIYTRKDDSFPSLYERSEIANKNKSNFLGTDNLITFFDAIEIC